MAAVTPPHDEHAGKGAGAEDAARALAEFRQFRERMNTEILGENNLVINRFFALDGRAYEQGALDVKTKELLGLVASLVLRCDDCVTYHVVRCKEEGLSRAEVLLVAAYRCSKLLLCKLLSFSRIANKCA